MKKRKLLPFVAIMVLLLSCTLAITATGSNAAMHIEHRVTNISNVAFTVSWTTDSACKAYVEYGETPYLGRYSYDDRGQDTVSMTHHILTGYLTPETTYYYDIVCDGIRYNNGGKHYSVTTGPSILPEIPHVIWGQIFKADGETPAEGSIVYVKVVDADARGSAGTSQVKSRLVDSDGKWGIVLGTLRTSELNEWFEYGKDGADSILVEFEGAVEGKASLEVPTGNTSRVLPSVSLQRDE
ncbi:MAG: fibronectin type III domain-containing protein [Dehalococcoidia bacterium]|nr:fibronectin type III domain-containing protein [Dehalococcoidia bacterium]